MLFSEGLFIRVDYTRCLNYQHNNVGCSHCVSHCPGQALTLAQDSIYLDEDKCLGCGLCFSDCPTEVFSAEQWNETTMTEEIRKQSAEITQLFCGYNDSPFRGKEDKDKGAVQIPTCLSSISKGAWYEVGLLTSIELRLEKCHECPMQQSLERMKPAIDTAMEWIAASGHTCDFFYISNAKPGQRKRKCKAVPTGLRVTSRRDLFLSLFNQGREAAVRRIMDRDYAFHGIHQKKQREESFLPNWQKRLEDSYTSHFQEGGTPAYWPSIHKNMNCVNCGLCSNNCPTQALQVKLEGQKVIHVFTSGHCIDCRICMLFCPTGSIVRERQPNSHPFNSQIIFEGTVVECNRCGEKIFPNKQHLCYWCQNEPTVSELVSDVWEQLFGGYA